MRLLSEVVSQIKGRPNSDAIVYKGNAVTARK